MLERSNCNETVLAERRTICELDTITLNGKPAMIRGPALRFPQVMEKETGLSCEFSWTAIYNVIENHNGEFFS